MCIGLPMTVIESDEFTALCERAGAVERVSVLLLGRQTPGQKLLVHLGTAMRALDATEAQLIDNALAGLADAIEGRAFDHLFADLIDREPELPAHLRDQ